MKEMLRNVDTTKFIEAVEKMTLAYYYKHPFVINNDVAAYLSEYYEIYTIRNNEKIILKPKIPKSLLKDLETVTLVEKKTRKKVFSLNVALMDYKKYIKEYARDVVVKSLKTVIDKERNQLTHTHMEIATAALLLHLFKDIHPSQWLTPLQEILIWGILSASTDVRLMIEETLVSIFIQRAFNFSIFFEKVNVYYEPPDPNIEMINKDLSKIFDR